MASLERYAELAIFVRVAEAEGFSAAARRLGLSTSYVSRVVARLEDRLGTQLFHRTTRRITLTEQGRALLERASHHIEQLDEAESVVAERAGALSGALRVTVPVQFGTRHLASIVGKFAALHPGVRIELCFDDRRVDLLEERFDLAIRVGRLPDSTFLARWLGASTQLTLASPAYLAKHGTPSHPRDLADHEVLLYTYQVSGPVWRYPGQDGAEIAVRVSGRFVSNSGEGTMAAAEAGVGITRVPDALAPIGSAPARWCGSSCPGRTACRSRPCTRTAGTAPRRSARWWTSWSRTSPRRRGSSRPTKRTRISPATRVTPRPERQPTTPLRRSATISVASAPASSGVPSSAD